MALRVASMTFARGDSGDLLHEVGRDAELGTDVESVETHHDLEPEDLENVDTRPKQGSVAAAGQKFKDIGQIKALRWNDRTDSPSFYRKVMGVYDFVDKNYETDPEACREALQIVSRDGMGNDQGPAMADSQLEDEVAKIRAILAKIRSRKQ